MEREELLKTLSLIAPALAPDTEVTVPILSGFLMDGKRVVAHDDIIAAMVYFNSETVGVVPGHPLLRFLKSCGGKQVEFLPDGNKKGNTVVKCAGARLRVPVEFAGKYPFKFPELFGEHIRDLDLEFFEGLELCSKIVADKGLTSWLGGVLFEFGEGVSMYSTNSTRDAIAAAGTQKSAKGKSEGVVSQMLPVSFCRTALSMFKRFGIKGAKLVARDKYACIYFGSSGAVWGRSITGDRPDFSAKVRSSTKGDVSMMPMPKNFRKALSRAASMGGKDVVTSLSIGEGKLKLRTKVGNAEIRDVLGLKGLGKKHPAISVLIDPKTVLRMMDRCVEFGVSEKCLIQRSERFTYVTANIET